mmetsp:Transcript_26397/g.56687  ORF Transcript_26397/g.56687 Transcript_26397/m.56687 type:complete len:220 (-) Transcript_26397:1503-2162(-)
MGILPSLGTPRNGRRVGHHIRRATRAIRLGRSLPHFIQQLYPIPPSMSAGRAGTRRDGEVVSHAVGSAEWLFRPLSLTSIRHLHESAALAITAIVAQTFHELQVFQCLISHAQLLTRVQHAGQRHPVQLHPILLRGLGNMQQFFPFPRSFACREYSSKCYPIRLGYNNSRIVINIIIITIRRRCNNSHMLNQRRTTSSPIPIINLSLTPNRFQMTKIRI